MKLFKTLFLIMSIGALTSCASSQHKPDDVVISEALEAQGEVFEGYITTKYKDQGCSILFAFTDTNGNEVLVRPIELAEEFKKDGLKVKIAFRFSRASNAGCDIAHPVIVESIEAI